LRYGNLGKTTKQSANYPAKRNGEKLNLNEGKLKEYDTVEEIWKNMQVAED
jgi:hypothetical protein